jgi:hypothetical protein
MKLTAQRNNFSSRNCIFGSKHGSILRHFSTCSCTQLKDSTSLVPELSTGHDPEPVPPSSHLRSFPNIHFNIRPFPSWSINWSLYRFPTHNFGNSFCWPWALDDRVRLPAGQDFSLGTTYKPVLGPVLSSPVSNPMGTGVIYSPYV